MKIRENGILRDMTAKEVAEFEKGMQIPKSEQIAELKQNLADTDYKAIKYAEGLLTLDEYENIRERRQAWRDEINRLESKGDTDV